MNAIEKYSATLTTLETALHELGILGAFIQKAQKSNMSIVEYLRWLSVAAPTPRREGEVDPAVNAVWERMLSDPTFFAEVSAEAYAHGIDLCDIDGEEARELCRN